MRLAAVDFETDGIDARPHYPPTPRGVAIQHEGRKGHYFKECKADLKARLAPLWRDKDVALVFHNAAFDLAVAKEELGLPLPHWSRIHDTLFLAFLDDPYSRTLSLKPSSERYLGMAPEEQEDVRKWLMENVPEARRSKKNWGRYIARAPYELLAPYAVGDVDRTLKLFTRLHTESIAEPYDRERRILPGLLANSARGIRCDRKKLARDVKKYQKAMKDCDQRIYKLLGCTFNIDSGDELADALEAAGKAEGFKVTATGKRSVAKGSLLEAVTCKDTLHLLDYRGRLDTALGTFMLNWLEMSEATGHVHFDWHQVRDMEGGARTGRLSSSPNVQNISKTLPVKAPAGLPELPLLRTYLLPDEGCVWVRKDYSQQELRMLAHFEDGVLLQQYLDNPAIDLHQAVADIMGIERTPAKTLAFALLYGMGIAELARRLGVEPDEAQRLKKLYLTVLPGIKSLSQGIQAKAKRGEAIRTWGGRFYVTPPPAFIDGRLRTFEYKLLNYLIQGSSADVTKEAMAQLFDAGLPGRFLCCVHDEINWSVPVAKQAKTIASIDRIMRSVKTDVPMLSTTELGTNWGTLREAA